MQDKLTEHQVFGSTPGKSVANNTGHNQKKIIQYVNEYIYIYVMNMTPTIAGGMSDGNE